jgi:chromosome segregation ATPase
MQHKELISVTKENEELKGRFGALVHEHSTEVTECTKLLQQLKNSNTKLNKELDEAKEEAALLRKYEAVAQKREEEQKQKYKQVETHYHNAAGRMEEAKEYLWSMYDDLLQNKEIEKSDLKFVIGLMYY